MNLNLGLESLNRVNGANVVPFTPYSVIEMQNASDAINDLMTSLENYYDAARNAMLVKKAIKKYGKTQSIVALIGQEGLSAAQTFSMEGFWQKTKDFLWKIWSKIKEWWGRFWGMFFSVEDRLRNFASSLNNKVLVSDCEFEGPRYTAVPTAAPPPNGTPLNQIRNRDIFGMSHFAKYCIHQIEQAAQMRTGQGAANGQIIDTLTAAAQAYHVGDHGEMKSAGSTATMTHKYTRLDQIRELATALVDHIFSYHRNSKKDIDRYTEQMLRTIKDLKVDLAHDTGRQGNLFSQGARQGSATATNDRDMTSEENDAATNIIKTCARINNQVVSRVMKEGTTIAVKLMANTRTKNQN